MENQRFIRYLKIVSVIVLLLASRYNCIQAEVIIPNSVKTFYGGMKKLSGNIDANEAYDICKSMKDCFFGMDVSVSGIPLPNDFRFFDYDDKNLSHRDESLNSTTYVNRLSDYIYKERVLNVDYKIVESKFVGEQPDFQKGRMSVSASLIATYIEKVYDLQGLRKVFNDTVYTDYSSGKINEIKNGNGKVFINIPSLRIKAALAYKLKHYEEAYKYYEQIISISENDADALYRLGLMTYYTQGCFLQKKLARKKGKEYMERAVISGCYSIIGIKAENVLHHWQYPRV